VVWSIDLGVPNVKLVAEAQGRWLADISWPQAIRCGGKTYIIWQGPNPDMDPYICTFDHTTKEFSDSVKIGDNPQGPDTHGQPVIAIDGDGYIYAFWGSHASTEYWKVSTYPLDITDWGAERHIVDNFTYPNCFWRSGLLWMFYRQGQVFGYRTLADKDGSFSAFTKIIDFTPNKTIYIGRVLFGGDGSIHLAWCHWDELDGYTRKNIYHMYSPDGGVTWKNMAGETLTIPLTWADQDKALVYDGGDEFCSCSCIELGLNYEPYISFTHTQGPGTYDCEHRVARYDAALGWVSSKVRHTNHRQDWAILEVTGEGQVKLYPIWLDSTTYRGGNLSEYTCEKIADPNPVWTETKQIVRNVSPSHSEPYGPYVVCVRPVLNAHPELKLIFTYGLETEDGGGCDIYGWGTPWIEDPKRMVVEALNGRIRVLDDDGHLVPVPVSGAWPDKDTSFPHVSVGPEISTLASVMDLGSHHVEYDTAYQVDVWVYEKRTQNYGVDRLRWDIRQEVERLLNEAMLDPGYGVKHIFVGNWRDLSDPERKILRYSGEVGVLYEKHLRV